MAEKKPEIRFKGFTDEWNPKKLEKLAESFEYGLNAAAKEYDGLHKYIRITDIDDITHEFRTDALTSPGTNINNVQKYKLEDGDILFARTGASVGKTYCYKVSDGIVYFAGFLIRMKVKPDYNAEFIFQNTLTDGYSRFVKITSQRSGQPGINAQEYSEYDIIMPGYSEQVQIGAFFHNLDNLITLHQHKYDKLISVKKAMLEKMFPKDGSDVPEIRFKGFTGAWERCKLGDISNKVKEKNSSKECVITLTNSAEFGIIKQRDYFDKDISNSDNIVSYYLVKNNDFVYNPRISNLAPVGPINRNKLGESGVMSPLYYVFRTHDIDFSYLEQFFKSTYWHQFMYLNGDTGVRSDRFSIKDSVLVEMPIPYPILAEQVKIGEFLSNLDNLIALSQCELEKLKNIKSACLEKMFV